MLQLWRKSKVTKGQIVSAKQVNCCHVLLGVRKRKMVCSRESDRVVVSDQRCHGIPRPSVVADRCNTECELRFVPPLYNGLGFFFFLLYPMVPIRPLGTGGTWPARASVLPSAAWDIAPWKSTAPKSATQTGRRRRSTIASAVVNTSPITRKVATETVTPVAGSTRRGQR